MPRNVNATQLSPDPVAQARDWFVRLKSGKATVADLDAFGAWRAIAENEAAYRETLTMWRALGPAITQAPPISDAPPLPSAAQGRYSRRQMLAGAGMAAAGAVLLPLAIGIGSTPAGATVLETRKGQRRRAVLPDGIVVDLNTNTRVVSWQAEGVRQLRLDSGEAIVSVAFSGQSAMRAAIDDTWVGASQARFLLRWLYGADPQVLCLSGVIDVQMPGHAFRLRSGDTVGAGDAQVVRETPADVASAAAWRSGMMVFERRPAGAVITELNRYREGRVFLPGSHADVPISGVIHLNRADAAVDHIARSLDMKVTRLPGGIVILRD